MAKVIKVFRTIRNNWKKSVALSVALAYGCSYAQDYFKTQDLMRVYCEKSLFHGKEALPMKDRQPKMLTVILNPNANRKKCQSEFNKYCAPILHLAGFNVNVISTESEGHAKALIAGLEPTDILVVAGGDGTFSEVLTGLLRRNGFQNTLPVGVLPLGRHNTLANYLFASDLGRVKQLADATLAIVEGKTRQIDVIKVDPVDGESKPIFGVVGLSWGAYRDARQRQDLYWFYGKLRAYATYLFNGYKGSLSWKCEGMLHYSPPCVGCANCVSVDVPSNKRKWFQRLSHAKKPTLGLNPECAVSKEQHFTTVDFNIQNRYLRRSPDGFAPHGLILEMGPKSVDYWSFVHTGFDYERTKKMNHVCKRIEARQVELLPKINSQANETFSIDNEEFEVKPIRITLLPNALEVFALSC